MSNQRKVLDVRNLFDQGFINGQALYMYFFNIIPSVILIKYIDGEKAFTEIRDKFSRQINSIYTYRYHEAKTKNADFSYTHMVLKNRSILEFNKTYCEIYHDGTEDRFVSECITTVKTHKARERRKPLEINLVTKGGNGIELNGMQIKRTQLDLDLFYENDFREVDQTIIKRLHKRNDKGIVLLHGVPGTGKTTYLRHLIGRIKKRILFVSPQLASDIMDPEFIELLIDNRDAVLVIEDAENIIMDRRLSKNASVSNLLNISDGLLADFLNVQIICTFNSPLTLIDSALLRKGRLIAAYEFGKLGVVKAQRLSQHFGFKTLITEPMTIAAIANQNEKETKVEKVEVLGFRREMEMN